MFVPLLELVSFQLKTQSQVFPAAIEQLLLTGPPVDLAGSMSRVAVAELEEEFEEELEVELEADPLAEADGEAVGVAVT